MSELRITEVDAFLIEGPRPWLLVRVETDGGVTGIGEVPRTRHTPADVERLGERLVGEPGELYVRAFDAELEREHDPTTELDLWLR
jgi:L-alanine-DL-glutamate epimerase-like enolase superfamily enzyme